MGGQRIGKCGHAGIEHTPRLEQRFLWFQHDGEFGEIKTPYINQCPGTLLGSNRCCMRECVANFTQPHRRKWRRQHQFRSKRRTRASRRFKRHLLSLYPSYLNAYSYNPGGSEASPAAIWTPMVNAAMGLSLELRD